MLVIKNLSGVYTGSGFKKKHGRKVTFNDCGYLSGPIDILVDTKSGRIHDVVKSSEANASPKKITGVTLGPARSDIPLSKKRTLTHDLPFFDGSGLVATPGFVDSHTHFIFSGERSNEFFLRWEGKSYQDIAGQGGGIHNTVRDTSECPDENLLHQTRENILRCLKMGTTTLEIKSGYANSATGELRLLRLIHELKTWSSKFNGPNIFSTFLALHALPKNRSESEFVSEMIAILPELSQKKLCDFVDAFPERGFFSLEETLRFVMAAKSVELPAKIHADELSNLETSYTMAQQGAYSVDHLQHISEKGVAALAKSSTIATLLPATSFYLGLPYTNARRLIDGGAQVALASDYNPGTAPSYSIVQTMLLAASQLKMNAAEIFCGVSFNGAAALGASESIGLIEKNYFADFCLWNDAGDSPQRFLESIISEQKCPAQIFVRGRHCTFG